MTFRISTGVWPLRQFGRPLKWAEWAQIIPAVEALRRVEAEWAE